MKLLEVRLNNIGPYINEILDLSTSDSKNIILICGNNGAGKTTIMKAIKLGLFGSTLFGLKQNSKSTQYVDEVKKLIKIGETSSKIEITFTIVENYEEFIYKIIREYNIEDHFKERVSLYINNKQVKGQALVNQLHYLTTMLTPSIVDAIIFDGEMTLSYIEQGNLSIYIKDSILNLFGLNKYVMLMDDLNSYIEEFVKGEKADSERVQLEYYEREVRNNKQNISFNERTIKDYKRLLEINSFQLDQKTEEYIKLGGINPEVIEDVKQEIRNIEKRRFKQRVGVKSFLENDLIFLINKDKINKYAERIESEKIGKYISELESLYQSSILSDDQDSLKNIISHLRELEYSDIILDLSNKEEKVFKGYIDLIGKAEASYKQLKFNNEDELNKLKELRSKVEVTESNEMNDFHDTIIQLIDQREEFQKILDQTNKENLELNEKLDENQKNLKELKKKVFENTKENDSYILAKKYLEVCEEYYNIEVEKILKLLSQECTHMIHDLFIKDEYITRVEITKDFDISLYSNGLKKPIELLSAGEQQLLVASVISAVVKISKTNLFVVYDTPVGRLDYDYKKRFYKEIMLKISKQVIIMPTSNDIDEEIVELIKGNVKRCYSIEYRNNQSNIQKNKLFDKEWNQDDSEN